LALTRKFLKALGLEEEKIEEIITAHSETVTALKEQIDQYKTDAEQLPAIKAELEKTKEGNGDSFKAKYEALKATHEQYVAEVSGKEALGKKQAAYRALLTECNISEKRQDAILKVALATDFEGVEFDENNGIKNADKVKPAIATEWAAFVETTVTKNPTVPTPPRSEANTLAELQKQYDDATKAGRLPEAIAAKNKLFEAQKNGG